MYIASVILQGLVLGTQIAMVALGLYLVSAASRIFHLAIGAIGTASAYALYWGISLEWPLWAAILCASCVALILGLLSARMLEPFALRQEPLLGLLESFGLGIILESLIAIFFGTDGKSLQTGILPVIHAGNVFLDLPGVITIALGGGFALLAWVLLQFTGSGRLLRSVAENSALAVSLGVHAPLLRRSVYCLVALIAGIIVSLAAWHTALTPLAGFQLIIAAFMASLLGGSDVRGAILASYLVALVPGFIIGFTNGLSENWRLALVFCIAAVVLSLRPQGMFAKHIREA